MLYVLAACITSNEDSMAERLRRVTRNHMGSARAGSNPAAVVSLFLWSFTCLFKAAEKVSNDVLMKYDNNELVS